MTFVPKKRKKADALVDRAQKVTVEEAVAILKKVAFAKFDETVDIAIRLGVNPKHADQMVRGALVLPHGTGTVTVVDGGLEIFNDAGTGSTLIASAAAVVWLDVA